MRGKRSKQYRKLMTQYAQIWGFREPYQCIIDAEMVADCHNFKYDLLAGLERTLHGKIKPMITQCEIRKLYARKAEPEMDKIIDFAKTLERRRCGHLPEDYPEPLSTNDCFKAVVDPKSAGVNKHKLVVVCQDDDVRRALRTIPGVPQIYLKRSVMILEPMASESAEFRAREEKSKYRAGIRGAMGPAPGSGAKRKRAAEEEEAASGGEEGEKKKKKKYGPKGPNPLAKQKPKKESAAAAAAAAAPVRREVKVEEKTPVEGAGGDEPPAKKKRKRKPRKAGEAGGEGGEGVEAVEGGEVAEAAEA